MADPALVLALEELVDPSTRGDPMSPLRWTCKSTRALAQALTEQGHPVSPFTVAALLYHLDYSLHGPRFESALRLQGTSGSKEPQNPFPGVQHRPRWWPPYWVRRWRTRRSRTLRRSLAPLGSPETRAGHPAR